jgi:hypothetical protein
MEHTEPRIFCKQCLSTHIQEYIKEKPDTETMTITRVENGFMLSYIEESEYEENLFLPRKVVFQELEDDDHGELTNIAQLFRFLMSQWGIYNSKHSEYNLRVEVVKTNQKFDQIDTDPKKN